MRIEQHIVAAWSKQLIDKLIKESIAALEQMDANEMLSGDDSGLKNVWEEICVQVQGEESVFWDAYVETIESLLSGSVELLDRDECLALWANTDEGWEYVFDHHADEDGVADVPVSGDEIVNKLKDELLSAAANYSNSRISKFLSCHDDGYDDLEDDEVDDEDMDDESEDQEDAEAADPEYEVTDGGMDHSCQTTKDCAAANAVDTCWSKTWSKSIPQTPLSCRSWIAFRMSFCLIALPM